MTTASTLVSTLAQRGETIAFCESLTAGLASATLAGVPGASAVLRGGLVVYATDLKASLAGVDPEILAQHGPVASETAVAMAAGARQRCAATWSVSLTGVAGPDPQDGHPVGEVFIAVAGPGELVDVQRHTFQGDRDQIRRRSVEVALETVLAAVSGEHEMNLFLRESEQSGGVNR